MSRVEPKDPQPKREAERGRRQTGNRRDQSPSPAEGDERTVDEALRHEEEKRFTNTIPS